MAQPTFPDAYVDSALQSACSAIATAGSGTRNAELNRQAFGMGQLVGAGAIPRQEAEAILFGAAETNGSVRDDGPAQVGPAILTRSTPTQAPNCFGPKVRRTLTP